MLSAWQMNKKRQIILIFFSFSQYQVLFVQESSIKTLHENFDKYAAGGREREGIKHATRHVNKFSKPKKIKQKKK